MVLLYLISIVSFVEFLILQEFKSQRAKHSLKNMMTLLEFVEKSNFSLHSNHLCYFTTSIFPMIILIIQADKF